MASAGKNDRGKGPMDLTNSQNSIWLKINIIITHADWLTNEQSLERVGEHPLHRSEREREKEREKEGEKENERKMVGEREW
jgi:hypothetical protein